jgi:hypothetical protein
MLSSRYARLIAFAWPCGRRLHIPFSSSPTSAAKHAPESNRGKHSQSMQPSRLTSAAVRVSPMSA